MHHPTRKYRIFKVTHLTTGYFALIITISREYSLMAFVERINEQAKWRPDRKFTNYAFAYFVRHHAPVVNSEFEVTLANGKEYSQQHIARSDAEIIALATGTEKLLNTKIVPNDKWELFNIGIQYFAGNGKKLLPVVKSDPSPLEKMGVVTVGTIPIKGKPGFRESDALMWVKANYMNLHVVTPDRAIALAACNKADQAVWAAVEVKLDMEVSRSWDSPTVEKQGIVFAHYGPTIAVVLEELQYRMEVILARHTPQTKYKLA